MNSDLIKYFNSVMLIYGVICGDVIGCNLSSVPEIGVRFQVIAKF